MLASKRLYPLIACAGIVVAAVAAVAGQADPVLYPDPLDLTISEYAALDRTGATGFAMTALGIAAFAVVAGLRAVGAPVGVLAERLMLVWGAGLIVLAVVPAALPGTGTDLLAQAYRYVSIAVLAAVPAAGGLTVARFGEDERWRPVARPVEWLTLAGGFGLLALTYVMLPGGGALVGLVEWTLLGAEVALVGVLAFRLVRLTWTRDAAPASRAALG
ncbi:MULTISPECIES: DUF998 domain-containing protein [unclassified Streptosporangium]|uniref:DUF998 domain-containing protein n=1 Tax=unclassified Streptosporangium TaxID=2632669 RepID=UPI002E2AA988|nr:MULTISPECIES: DUF998 domain-containing protein [unclassified Streptosporangium]